MYRGSRLAASFLLFLTGSAVLALAMGVLPRALPSGAPWLFVPIVVVYGVAHLVALVGIARARTWGRDLAVTIAETGGGLAIAGLVAIGLGADPFATSSPCPKRPPAPMQPGSSPGRWRCTSSSGSLPAASGSPAGDVAPRGGRRRCCESGPPDGHVLRLRPRLGG